jgi:prepilin-type N-terminal cleavage/methylation domain-containing protein
MLNNKKAFTLIELLVAVLIIGILAAIALPQYQKAVKKAGFSQAFVLGKAVNSAQKMWSLIHGDITPLNRPTWQDLDISLPEGFVFSTKGEYYRAVSQKVSLDLRVDTEGYNEGFVVVGFPEFGQAGSAAQMFFLTKSDRILCFAQKQKKISVDLCTSINGIFQKPFDSTYDIYIIK